MCIIYSNVVAAEMVKSDSNTRIAKNTLFLSIRMMVVLLINLFTTRAILAGLGADDFGIYNVVCGFVSMFTFLSHSISNGIQRFYNYELGKHGAGGAQNIYVTSLFIQLLIVLVLVLFTESFGLWYVNTKMVIPDNRIVAANFIFQFSIVSFIFTLLQSPYSASIIAHEKMDFFAFMSVMDAVLKLGIALAIPYYLSDKLIIYGLLILLISVINFFVYYLYSKKKFVEIKLKRYFNPSLIKEMLSFSGWNIFGVFSDMLKEQGLNLIINVFFGPVVNAARAVSYQVSSAIRGFVSSASVSVRPQIVQSYAKGSINRSLSLVYSLTKITTVLYIAFGCPIILEVNYILHLWLGGSVPDHTASFVVIVILISLVNNMNSALSGIVHASGQMRDYQLYGGLISLLSVPASYFVLYFWGEAELAFWVCLLFTVIMQIVSLFIVRGIVGLSIRRYCTEIVIPMTVVAIIAFFVPYLLHGYLEEGFIRLILVAFTSTILTVLSSYFIALTKKERDVAKELLRKIKSRAN